MIVESEDTVNNARLTGSHSCRYIILALFYFIFSFVE